VERSCVFASRVPRSGDVAVLRFELLIDFLGLEPIARAVMTVVAWIVVVAIIGLVPALIGGWERRHPSH
jgi:hypothetical protein